MKRPQHPATERPLDDDPPIADAKPHFVASPTKSLDVAFTGSSERDDRRRHAPSLAGILLKEFDQIFNRFALAQEFPHG